MANLLENLMELADRKSATVSISDECVNAQRGADFIMTACRWEDGTPITLEENLQTVIEWLSKYDDGPVPTGKCQSCGGEAVLHHCDENMYCYSCGKAYYHAKRVREMGEW